MNPDTTTEYDRLVAAIQARNAAATETGNGRRMIARLKRGTVSMWEATCGLTPVQEYIPTLEEFRYARRGSGMVTR